MRTLRGFVSVFLVLVISFLSCGIASAAIQIPEKVRIGLYFSSSASSSFSISAEKGIQMGIYKNSTFSALFEEPSNNIITVRKDSYFVKSGSSISEYNPAGTVIPAGEKIGPFHVQLLQGCKDLKEAAKQAQAATQKGIAAYPAYAADGWQVWTGYYTDQASAQADLANNINKKLGQGLYSIIQPSPTRVAALKSTGDTALIIDSASGALQVHPRLENNPYVFKLNTKRYRGDLEVIRQTGSDMTLVNVLPMDQYLYGVVPSEIESYSQPEALKAQAVASRTYALDNLDKYEKWNFNLCNTTACQVYKGYDVETPSTNKAVDDTKGKVIIYSGKPAEVFFFSSSGGRTEDAKNVWGGDVPYLKSVGDKYEDVNSPHYYWKTDITAEKIKSIMTAKGYDIGDIVGVTIAATSDAGRVTQLVIKGTKGEHVYTRGESRTVFGLNSQWYTISTDSDVFVSLTDGTVQKAQVGDRKVVTAAGIKTISMTGGTATVLGRNNEKKAVPAIPKTYILNGKGWGHGVGMSQEGAKGMAKAGFKFDEILQHYFPGTKVE